MTFAEEAKTSETEVTVTPSVRAVVVDGDKEKFREDLWMLDDWAGGLTEFRLRHLFKSGWEFTLDGRVIVPEEDYKLGMSWVKSEVGFVRVGFSEYRKYFDGTGGFYRPFSTRSFELNRDLHLDIGSIYAEFGLTRPDWPKITLGYERKFKVGDKSMIEWGSVTQTLPPSTTRKIFPAVKEIDETVDIFKLDVEQTLSNLTLTQQSRYELYSNDTTRLDDAQRNLTTNASKDVTARENYSHDAFSNAFQIEQDIGEKVYWSVGYLFTAFRGDASIRLDTVPFNANNDKNWMSRTIRLDQDSHVVNTSAMFGPFNGLTIYGGLQGEKAEFEGYTDAVLTEILAGMTVSPEATIRSARDKEALEENFGLRYTKIPHTTLYAEIRLNQENIGVFEREIEDGSTEIDRLTDTDILRQRYTIGFNTSPWPRMHLAAHYRYSLYETNYDHLRDIEQGYSAFITAQEFTTHEFLAKLTVRPTTKLSLMLQYQLVATDFDTSHDESTSAAISAGSLQSGEYDAAIYSVSATYSPVARFYCTGQFSFSDTSTRAFDNGVPSITTYHGDVYSVLATLGYIASDKTDFNLQYWFSMSDNFTDNSAAGLPLGVDNQRHGLMVGCKHKFRENLIGSLRYGFFLYNESSIGHIDDYSAHIVVATMSLRF